MFFSLSSTDSYSAYACTFEVLNLTCPSEKTISVTSAYFAQYNEPCESYDCCTPYPGDCSELMETEAPLSWTALLATCNNRTTCSIENPGVSVQSCAEPYNSDYAIAYYSCLPGTVKINPLFDVLGA